MKLIGLLLASLALATPVSAQVLNESAAAKALFPTRGHTVQLSGSLSAMERKIVTGIIPLMAEQLRQPVRYYAAIAWSPDDGLVHDSIQAAMNYHSPGAAATAAVAACNKLKSRGAQTCKVAAQIVPKGYRPRELSLSVDATAAFNRSYRKKKGSKAFATSRSTGAWAIGGSDSAAISACENAGSRGDCEIVIRD